MKLPSVATALSWIFRNWGKIKPVLQAAWDLVGLYESKDKPGAEKESEVINSLQSKFPLLSTTLAKFAVIITLLLRRVKTKPQTVENQVNTASLTEPAGTFVGEK